MNEDEFDFDAALAAKAAEEIASRNRSLKRLQWAEETHTDSYIAIHKVPDKVGDAIREFLSRGGRIQSSRTVWIPSDHPYDFDIVIDEGCIVSPPLPEFESADTYPLARRTWEIERDRVRAQVTALWDTKFPRAPAMDFGFWEQEGPHEMAWIFVDEEDVPWSFGSNSPRLDKVRKKLVETLHQQIS